MRAQKILAGTIYYYCDFYNIQHFFQHHVEEPTKEVTHDIRMHEGNLHTPVIVQKKWELWQNHQP